MPKHRVDDADVLKRTVENLINVAERNGFVITVEQQPQQPLAMGNYKTVVQVREKRPAN